MEKRNHNNKSPQDKEHKSKKPTGNIGFLYRHPDKNEQFSKEDTVKLNQFNLDPINKSEGFNLILSYPGLYVGMGYSIDEKLENGMSFDYTTGLPYIPGSEVKGMLRSCFVQHAKDTLGILNKFAELKTVDKKDLATLEYTIFGNPNNNDTPQGSVIFYDAFPNKGEIRPDNITPHKDELKNPIPIQTLKVASGSVFQFQFYVPESLSFGFYKISRENLIELFKNLILDWGIGAKTRLGYGTFQEAK